ncbi:membrane protein YdbS with pleckstrin-like domain [Allocatelliglobosispora scoriae]|uniref:Membrane protein YdbS with pleckstrin-like domain n=1 Tax=Allocatelliglobosispora scoriae TaxID=643052 RepID=A0A841BJB9_9ACTN|nr:hypothetical protein [Allocatelliglobosispora scoriae]MBB5867133.1 membrane protein YdbS with pleckstrin-like domain [Allocatelliglobosispora scoriae]
MAQPDVEEILVTARDLEQSSVFRRSLAQFAVTMIVFTVVLWLLAAPTWVFVATEAAAGVVSAVRLWGPGELDNAQEYALIVATEFTWEVVEALAADERLRDGWGRAGVRTGLLAGLTPASAAAAAETLRRTARPRVEPWTVALVAVLVTAGTVLALEVLAQPSCIRISTTAVTVFVVAAVVAVASRLVRHRYNERQRHNLRAHLAADPRQSIVAELRALLASGAVRQRTMLAAALDDLCDPNPERRPSLPAVAAVLLPYAVLGAVAALWLTGLTTAC